MTVKVVILNWNGAEILPRFLPSVVAATPPRIEVAGMEAEVEIVVADNGSTDGSTELLRRDFPSVRVLELDRNYGFAGGYNRALAQTEADHYVLLNSDVETPEGWLAPLVEMLETRPEVAAVAPKILSWTSRDTLASSRNASPADGDVRRSVAETLASSQNASPADGDVRRSVAETLASSQNASPADGDVRRSVAETFEYAGASGGFIDFLGYPFCRGRILDTIERDEGQYDDARDVFWASGACFACRADAFRSQGGFDESFFAHQEEIDLCWRMQSAGWRVAVEPRSAVYHLGAGTLPPSPQKLYLNHRNNLAMLYKNLPHGAMQAVVATRMVLDGLEALLRLARGERENFVAIVRAHRDFRRAKREGLRDKRRQIQSARIAHPVGIYRRPIVLGYIFGRRLFSQLKNI